jgi:hypothetical protein
MRGSSDTGTGPWLVRLTCCEHDDGIHRCQTWREAQAFRESYTGGVVVSRTGMGDQSGHRRTAIIEEAPDGPVG